MRVPAVLLSLSALVGYGCAGTAERPAFTGSPAERFVDEAARLSLAEIELGRAALEKAGDARVKELGRQIADDHRNMLDELKSLASRAGMAVPDRVSEAQAEVVEHLTRLEDSRFDREYLACMIADHEQALLAFREEEKAGKDSEVRAFAARHAPTLEHHLTRARELGKDLGAGVRPTAPWTQGGPTPGAGRVGR